MCTLLVRNLVLYDVNTLASWWITCHGIQHELFSHCRRDRMCCYPTTSKSQCFAASLYTFGIKIEHMASHSNPSYTEITLNAPDFNQMLFLESVPDFRIVRQLLAMMLL